MMMRDRTIPDLDVLVPRHPAGRPLYRCLECGFESEHGREMMEHAMTAMDSDDPRRHICEIIEESDTEQRAFPWLEVVGAVLTAVAIAVGQAGCCASPLDGPVADAWPLVREDASLGVMARMDHDFMAQRDGDALSYEAAQFRLERIDLMDAALKKLAQ